jgi:DtxR family transcriptional regulator, Mn-dependent transcriptional regulator
MVAEMTLSESLEDYLEAIFHISAEKQAAKAKDIAKRMKVGASSVTGALHQLADRKLINYSPYDLITLTAQGREIAEGVVKRHTILKDFFVRVLSVDREQAEHAACQMEHAVTADILERFTRFIEFVDTCPRAGSKWIQGFGYLCDHEHEPANCKRCVTQTLEDIEEKIQGATTMGNTKKLNQIPPGSKARITGLSLTGDTARRFSEMGVITGSIVKVERIAPLGDPVEITVKGYQLSLRKADLDQIEVAPLEE